MNMPINYFQDAVVTPFAKGGKGDLTHVNLPQSPIAKWEGAGWCLLLRSC